MSAVRRDIATFLQRLRAFLLGREHTLALRFEDGVADRSQPPPEIPYGPTHLLSANYYALRDARREVQPPINLMQQQKLLEAQPESGASGADTKQKGSKLPAPGKLYHWD